MREAFAIARSGRHGPVLIDIAKNVTAAEADYTPLPLEQHASQGRLGAMLRRASHDLKTPEPDAGDIQTLLDLIETARMPLVLVGGGVIRSKGAVPEFRSLWIGWAPRWPPPSWAAARCRAAIRCLPA